MAIDPLRTSNSIESYSRVGRSLGPIESKAPRSSFTDELKESLAEVDRSQHQSDEAMSEGAVEGAKNIHETMIQVEEADLSARMLMKVRNKALDAYQEIMRMQF